MAATILNNARPTRRQFLSRSASTLALAGMGGIASPFLSRAADRPNISCGLQSGDVSTDKAVVWARADRAARMQVDYATTESFRSILGSRRVDVLPDSDFTAKLLLEGLPSGQDIFYRVRFDNIADDCFSGETQVGHFRTAPAVKRSISSVTARGPRFNSDSIEIGSIEPRYDRPTAIDLRSRI